MTDPSQLPEAPEAAETASFLRRFAGLMSNGYNAKYLHRAADLLETLTPRIVAAEDEEKLWRYKYETVTAHADELEVECDTLKQDIEGHLNIATAILSERDHLKSTLQAREAAFAELNASLGEERDRFARQAKAHEEALAALRAAFDREREALKAAAKEHEQELEQLKGVVRAGEVSLAEHRVVLDRERTELQAQRKVHEDEMEALRVVYRRECDELQARIVAHEAKRAELRSAFDRISDLRSGTTGGRSGAEGKSPPAGSRDEGVAAQEVNAVVPKATLRQARDQFEYLAKDCVLRGDIASQVMCELGAYTIDLALTVRRESAELPVGAVARDILAPSNPANG